jgi:hypothetical protein
VTDQNSNYDSLEKNNVPITFVGYDLGGSIVKKVTLQERSTIDMKEVCVSDSVCFLLGIGISIRKSR